MLKLDNNEMGTGEGRPPQKLPAVEGVEGVVLLVSEVLLLVLLVVLLVVLLAVLLVVLVLVLFVVLVLVLLVVLVVVELLLPPQLAPLQYTVITVETEYEGP